MTATEDAVMVGKHRDITLPEAVSAAVDLQPGDTVRVRAIGPKLLELTVLPRMTFEAWIEQYRIDEPVDVDKLIAEAEEAQADEYVRKFNEGRE